MRGNLFYGSGLHMGFRAARRKNSDAAPVQRDRRSCEIRFSFRMADDAEISKPVY